MASAAEELSMTLELAEFSIDGKDFIAPIFYDKDNKFSFSAIGYGGAVELSDTRCLDREGVAAVQLANHLEKAGKGHFYRSVGLPLPICTDNGENAFPKAETAVIPLAANVEETFSRILTGNVRTAIRKAQASGVTCRELGAQDIKPLHKLIVSTQTNVGSAYLTRLEFITSLFNLEQPDVKFFGAFVGDNLASGVILLADGEHAFHYLHGWNRDQSGLCVNQAVLWYAVAHAIRTGRHWFNMGASHTKPLLHAKLRWGARIERYLSMDSSDMPIEKTS